MGGNELRFKRRRLGAGLGEGFGAWMKGTVAASFLILALALPAGAQTAAGHWVGSWATSPFAAGGPFVRVPDVQNATLRQIVHLTLGGSALRVRFTNEFGTEPLQIQAADVALSAGNGAIQAGSDHALTFNGKASIVIPPGALALSDPVPLATKALTDLAISMYFPSQQITVATFHGDAAQTSYVQQGNAVSAETLASPAPLRSWYFVKDVDVEPSRPQDGAVVAFGDSITDGAFATMNENHRWPDFLARRLQADARTKGLSVLNEGIGGNRILRDGTGPSALARFDRDVLAQAGVKYMIVLEGINDIGRLARANDPADAVTAEDLEQGLQQLVARAHEHGIKVFGATLTPYQGAGYYSAKGEAVREALNQWIRTSGVFDAVVDFDKTTRDPANPNKYLPKFDHGDHLHPSDAGYEAMGDSIDLSLFK